MANVKVGDRFENTVDQQYSVNGEKRIHHLLLLVEVTLVDDNYAEWETVAVLEETGRPEWQHANSVTKGGFNIRLLPSITYMRSVPRIEEKA